MVLIDPAPVVILSALVAGRPVKALIVTKIKIGLGAVIGHETLRRADTATSFRDRD